MRRTLGDGYVDAVRTVWREVPESADLVMYWWHIAAETLRKTRCSTFPQGEEGGLMRHGDLH
jgi:hypothetical protein